MTIAKFKTALESTGYEVAFTNQTDVAYNENTLLVNVIEYNTIHCWIKANVYITASEPVVPINKLNKVDKLVLISPFKSNTSYYDNRFTWYQEVLWHFDKADIEELAPIIDNINTEINKG